MAVIAPIIVSFGNTQTLRAGQYQIILRRTK
jgi:hypothetical protein